MFQRRFICLLTLFAVVFLPQMVLAGNWTQFRGPGGLGISQEKDLPIGWSEAENVA